MKTIKLIDLFIKIANDEDTPKKIEFKGNIFTHNGDDSNCYYYCKEKDKLLEDSFIFEELNENVEIIEDIPKEVKKIEYIEPSETMFENHINIIKKINEIIDKINGDEENEN